MHVILFGPPACGKGTQAKRLMNKGFQHISTGDMLREELAQNTEIGKSIGGVLGLGTLISDDIVIEMVRRRIGSESYIYDGFPRTVPQAVALDALLLSRGEEIAALINLEVDPAILLDRVAIRFSHSGRDDDNPDTFAVRLNTYYEKTQPVLDHYRHIVQTVDGMASPEVVAEEIAKILG
jgi:adenylate kinase